MDELDMVGYIDMERQFFEALNSGGDDEEKKKDFLLKNVGWINLGVFLGGIVSIIEIAAASSAQLKGAEEIIPGIESLEMGIGKGIVSETVSAGGSVCVDMVAVEDGEIIEGFGFTGTLS